jgi:hypothetical protein
MPEAGFDFAEHPVSTALREPAGIAIIGDAVKKMNH